MEKKYLDPEGLLHVVEELYKLITEGESGATFTPHLAEDGTLSWTNDKELENPESVNIKGQTGQGIESTVLEFYMSTSKTTQTGGSWTESMPTWEAGKYLWSRFKITYKNPEEIEYTEPFVDTSWEYNVARFG